MSFLDDKLVSKSVEKLSPENRRKLKKATYRAVDFIEFFLPDPRNPRERVKLGPYQKEFIDYIQYGFPLKRFKFSEIDTPPEGVIFITRRKVGKSFCCAYACAALMVLGPTSIGHPPTRCGIIAASEDEARLLIDKVKYCFENSVLKNYIKGRPRVQEFELTNGSKCVSHTCSVRSIRGPGYDYLFIDESAWMEEHILFSAALPTVEHGERWIAITTPNGKEGKLIEYYYKGLESRRIICKNCLRDYMQSEFPNKEFEHDPTKLPKLPDCEECGENDYKYGVGVFGVPFLDPWKCPIIDQDKLKRRLKIHGYSPWARQEWLGEILDEASKVILKEWIDKITNKSLRNTMTKKKNRLSYVLGVDYGRQRDASSFCVTHVNPKNKRTIWDYMRTVSGEFDLGTDYDSIHEHLKEIILFYDPDWVVADSTGKGDPQVERLDKDLKKWRRQGKIHTKLFNNKKNKFGFHFDRKTKQDLIGLLLTKLSNPEKQLEIPPTTEPEVDKFVRECLRFECEVQDSGYIKYGTQNFHDDRIIAYALSLWGHRKKKFYMPEPKMISYSSKYEKQDSYNVRVLGGYGGY